MPKCKVCGKKLKVINDWHLRTHDMTTEEYRKLFPNTQLFSSKIRKKMRKAKLGKTLSKKHKESMSKAQEQRHAKMSEEEKKEYGSSISEGVTKNWEERREKYGQSGIKDVEAFKDKLKGNTNRRGKPCSKESREKMSLARSGKTYEQIYGDRADEMRDFQSRKQKKFVTEHPEMHPNRIMARRRNGVGFPSKPQKELFQLLKTIYPDAELELPIRTKKTIRYADVGVKSKKIDFEFDGEYWVNFKDMEQRDKELADVGWVTVRIDKHLLNELKTCSDLECRVSGLMCV